MPLCTFVPRSHTAVPNSAINQHCVRPGNKTSDATVQPMNTVGPGNNSSDAPLVLVTGPSCVGKPKQLDDVHTNSMHWQISACGLFEADSATLCWSCIVLAQVVTVSSNTHCSQQSHGFHT